MSQSINIERENNSRTGEYRRKVLSELEKLHKNLIELSGLYGFEASCLNAWKQTFLDTLWSLFSAMLPVKLREQECLLMQPCVLLSDSDQRCSLLPGESLIHPASAIKVNTVSPLYLCSRSSSPEKMWSKYVPFLRLTGEWLLDYGFEIGKKFEIYATKNQLILKIGNQCNGNGGGISSDNDNTDTDTDADRNGNVPYPDGDRIGGKNG
jgi:hypothetical protein